MKKVSITLLSCTALAIAGTAIAGRHIGRETAIAEAMAAPPEQSVASQTAETADRIIFPPKRPGTLPLPDGKRSTIHSMLNVTEQMQYGQFVWNEKGVPAGRAWIRIDLAEQTMSVFRAGHEIGTAVILFGADSKPTPTGRFPILARFKDHRSSLYDAEMPYTLRLTQDGVAIHGSNVRRGAATHGCIGVPTAFAAHLFEQVRVGSIVVIMPETKAPATT